MSGSLICRDTNANDDDFGPVTIDGIEPGTACVCTASRRTTEPPAPCLYGASPTEPPVVHVPNQLLLSNHSATGGGAHVLYVLCARCMASLCGTAVARDHDEDVLNALPVNYPEGALATLYSFVWTAHLEHTRQEGVFCTLGVVCVWCACPVLCCRWLCAHVFAVHMHVRVHVYAPRAVYLYGRGCRLQRERERERPTGDRERVAPLHPAPVCWCRAIMPAHQLASYSRIVCRGPFARWLTQDTCTRTPQVSRSRAALDHKLRPHPLLPTLAQPRHSRYVRVPPCTAANAGPATPFTIRARAPMHPCPQQCGLRVRNPHPAIQPVLS